MAQPSQPAFARRNIILALLAVHVHEADDQGALIDLFSAVGPTPSAVPELDLRGFHDELVRAWRPPEGHGAKGQRARLHAESPAGLRVHNTLGNKFAGADKLNLEASVEGA